MTTNPGNKEVAEKDLPIGHAEAYKALSGRSSYRSMRYRVLAVNSLYIEERHYSCQVRNPRYTGLRKLFEPAFITGSARGLSNLYIDGKSEGPLHGSSEGMARGIAAMLENTRKPVDLVISGHFTESGWYVDSVKVLAANA